MLWNPTLISKENIKYSLPHGVLLNCEGKEVPITDELLNAAIAALVSNQIDEVFASQAYVIVRASELGYLSEEYILGGW
jgi:hypothetical protein